MASLPVSNSTTPNNVNEPTPAPFNCGDCSKYLTSRHTAAIEALHAASNAAANGTTPVLDRVEIYRPPGQTNNNIAGSWGSGKHTSMTNGQDFLSTLWNKFESSPAYQSHLTSIKAANNSTAPNPPGSAIATNK